MEKLYCPLCHQEAVVQKQSDRDWVNICCLNPNCLSPSTGWMTELMAKTKWDKYVEQNKQKSVIGATYPWHRGCYHDICD